MSKAREKAVSDWIAENFVLEAVTVEPFDLFPYGRRIIDQQGGEMVVYFDLMAEKVVYCFPDIQPHEKDRP